MTMSMHAATVPVFRTMLHNLAGWLDKAQADAQARRFEVAVLLGARLAPDMLPLSRQVQIACDTAKFAVARLSGVEAPSFADDERTVEELKARIAATLAFVESVPAAQVDGSESRAISLPMRGREPMAFTGLGYVQQFALPNFFFHVTTAYAILRHNGVPLGKPDYLRGG